MANSTPAPKGLRGYFRRANLLTSLVLIFPLFLVYQLGVIARPEALNGADLITVRVYRLLGTTTNYLLFNLALLVVFAVALVVMRRRQQFDTRLFVPVVLESGLYAITMGAAIVYVMSLIGIS